MKEVPTYSARELFQIWNEFEVNRGVLLKPCRSVLLAQGCIPWTALPYVCSFTSNLSPELYHYHLLDKGLWPHCEPTWETHERGFCFVLFFYWNGSRPITESAIITSNKDMCHTLLNTRRVMFFVYLRLRYNCKGTTKLTRISSASSRKGLRLGSRRKEQEQAELCQCTRAVYQGG